MEWILGCVGSIYVIRLYSCHLFSFVGFPLSWAPILNSVSSRQDLAFTNGYQQ